MKTTLAIVGGLTLVVVAAVVGFGMMMKRVPDKAIKQQNAAIEELIDKQHPDPRVTAALRRIEQGMKVRNSLASLALVKPFLHDMHNAVSLTERQVKTVEDVATLLETQDVTFAQVQAFLEAHKEDISSTFGGTRR